MENGNFTRYIANGKSWGVLSEQRLDSHYKKRVARLPQDLHQFFYVYQSMIYANKARNSEKSKEGQQFFVPFQ